MAKTKYFVPEKEQPHFNEEKGWIEKIEYQIKPYFEVDENDKIKKFVLDIYSFREFAFFKYSIAYEVEKKKNDIFITLRGLSTNNQVFPDYGKARAQLEFDVLAGDYNFYFRRSSGEENLFKFNIDPVFKKITLKKELPDKKTNRKFVELLS
ncbi:MAG: hypothetical protein N3F03_08475 [Ignavibacteria bacterium]|nr:hypothetical protein [Ignavibacteria bacterium]